MALKPVFIVIRISHRIRVVYSIEIAWDTGRRLSLRFKCACDFTNAGFIESLQRAREHCL